MIVPLLSRLSPSNIEEKGQWPSDPSYYFWLDLFHHCTGHSCVRTWNIAKYLARLGWQVTVVTPHPSVWRHVDNPESATAQELKREGIKRIFDRSPVALPKPNGLEVLESGSWLGRWSDLSSYIATAHHR